MMSVASLSLPTLNKMDFRVRHITQNKACMKIHSVESIYAGKPDIGNYLVRNRIETNPVRKCLLRKMAL